LLKKYHSIKLNNKVKELSHHLSIAKSLGIKDNNLGSKSSMSNYSLIVDSNNSDIQDIQELQLPKWYFFGENALTKEIELLKNKKYSFIPEISKLEIEKIRLESFVLSNTDINSMQLNQRAFTPNSPIKPNKRKIVSVAAVFGFMLSIVLVLLMNAFRTREITKSHI